MVVIQLDAILADNIMDQPVFDIADDTILPGIRLRTRVTRSAPPCDILEPLADRTKK